MWLEHERDGQLALVKALTPEALQPTGGCGGGVGCQWGTDSGAKVSSGTSLRLQLAQFLIHDGEVHWVDAAVPARQARERKATDIEVAVSASAWPVGGLVISPCAGEAVGPRTTKWRTERVAMCACRSGQPLSAALERACTALN